MECPDPITKLTWDNAIMISPRLAKELEESQGVQIFPNKKPMNSESEFFKVRKAPANNKAVFKRGKEQAVLAELLINGRTVKAPIHVVPGMANYTLVLPLGMGREVVDRVGMGVGFNAYSVRDSKSLPQYLRRIAQADQRALMNLANTQEHWSMEGRAIIREGNADYYKKHPDFAQKMGVESHAPANYGKDDNKSLQEKSTGQYRGNSAYEHPSFADPAPNVKVWQGKS